MEKKIIKHLKFYLNCLLDVIYCGKDSCAACGSFSENTICSDCKNKIRYAGFEGYLSSSDIETIQNKKLRYYSPVYYSSVVKELIIALKYKSDFNCGNVLAKLMERLIEEKNLSFDAIAFVPLSKKAYIKRGYNQSEFLARIISENTSKELVDVLVKTKATKDQIGLSGELRWDNLRGSFKIKNGNKIKGKKILLVDDVITTGATTFYCSEVLLNEGCKDVIVLTAAKSNV